METVAVSAPAADSISGGSLRCPRCSAELGPYAQFCDICGHGVSGVNFETFEGPLGIKTTAKAPDVSDDQEKIPTLEILPVKPVSDVTPLAAETEAQSLVEVTSNVETFPEFPADVAPIIAPAIVQEVPPNVEPEVEPDISRAAVSEIALEAPVADQEAASDIDATEVAPDLSSQQRVIVPVRTTDFTVSRETARQDRNARLTVEGRRISTGQIEEEVKERVSEDVEEKAIEQEPRRIDRKLENLVFDPDPVDADLEVTDYTQSIVAQPSARTQHPHSSPSANGSSKVRRHASPLASVAVITALFILGVLLTIIAWQALRKRDASTDQVSSQTNPRAGDANKAAASPQPSGAGAPVTPEGMVYVAGATFTMGRDDGDEYAKPSRQVTVPGFFIDRTEVTNEQYQKFVEATSHRPPPHWRGGKYLPGEGRLPVVNVSWRDAFDYARWARKRLPTESEWELAARGTDARIYTWGSQWNSSFANTRDAGRGRIAEVGSFPQGSSPYGALDMIGNVWEWTASDLTKYGVEREVLQQGKVIRGGAFDVPTEIATVTYRGVLQPEKTTYDKTGFRCVRGIR
jgi:formylglycine-generating enzyme required for sulfatase activity